MVSLMVSVDSRGVQTYFAEGQIVSSVTSEGPASSLYKLTFLYIKCNISLMCLFLSIHSFNIQT